VSPRDIRARRDVVGVNAETAERYESGSQLIDGKVARQELEEIRVLRDCREHFQIVSKRAITDSEGAKVQHSQIAPSGLSHG
jgi:hypothetical protein